MNLQNAKKQMGSGRPAISAIKTRRGRGAAAVSAFALSGLLAGAAPSIWAYKAEKKYLASERPFELRGLEVRENPGAFIDLSLPFADEEGHIKPLRSYFIKGAPALLTVVYYRCPGICNFHLQGLFEAAAPLPQKSGQDYSFIVISMDSQETPLLAGQKKAAYREKHPSLKPIFLTGSQASIQALTQTLGFSFRYEEESQQFAHSPVAYTLTGDGKILRYLYGVEFEPQTLRLSLVEAGKPKLSQAIDRILLFCYRFDPGQSRYTLYSYNIMRAGAGLSALLLAAFLIPAWRREAKKKAKGAMPG